MPMYTYRADDGTVIDCFYHMNDARPESFEQDGKTYRRVYGNCQTNDMKHVVYPYVSKRHAGTPLAKDCEQATIERKGVKMQAPIIRSAAHERELAAKHGLKRE